MLQTATFGELFQNDKLIIFAFIVAYILLMAFMGIKSLSATKNMEGFTVGGRKAGPWLSAFSYGTTYFSAVVFIGYAGGSGWGYGLWATLIGLGNAIIGSLLAWIVLAEKTRAYTQEHSITSMPSLFEVRYSSKLMKTLAAIIIFVFLIPYSASVFTGLSYICEIVIGIKYEICMAIIAVAAIISLVFGGYTATLKIDLFQGIIMLIGVVALIWFMITSDQVNGIEGLRTLWDKMETAGIAKLEGKNLVSFISLIILTSLGTWGLPQMIHKYYGLADKKSVLAGTVISTLFSMIISGAAYFNGSLSRLFFEPDANGSALINGVPATSDIIVPNMLLEANLPVVLIAVILVLLISASVSTLSGVTLTAATSVSQDIIKSSVKKNMSEKFSLTLTRILCVIFIIFSYCVAVFKIEAIINLMAFSWGALAGSFLGPYMVGLYMKSANKFGGWVSFLGGLLINLTLNIKDAYMLMADGKSFNLPNAPINGVIAMVSSVLLCIVCSAIANKFLSKKAVK